MPKTVSYALVILLLPIRPLFSCPLSLANRPVAAIVYLQQEHFINDFVWPAASRAIDFDVQSHQGCSLCGWNKFRLNYAG